MSDVRCKRCGGASFVKNGMVRGQQRYRCKGYGLNFTNTADPSKPAALVVLLYAMGNAS